MEVVESGFVKGYPTPEKVEASRFSEDFQKAIIAYRFWYPTIAAEGAICGLREQGIRDNEVIACLKATPAGRFFTPNSDTPYGLGIIDLRAGPIIIEVPPGPIVGVVNDHHQRWVMDMGLTSAEGDRGGRYLVLPPDFRGIIPMGFKVAKSDSYINLVVFRMIPISGDQDEAISRLKLCRIFPYSSVKDPRCMRFENLSGREFDLAPLRWEESIDYWKKLKEIIDLEPGLVGIRGLTGLLASLGIEKGVAFSPDENDRKLLVDAGKEAKAQMLISAFASERPERAVWSDRRWEWVSLVVGNGNFERETGIDLEARDRWFCQAFAASPAIFNRNEGAGFLFWLGLRDRDGAYLDGGRTYKLTVPGPVPARLFWSVSVYDNETRSFIETDQNRAALRSLYELRSSVDLASVDLFFGPEAPQGKEASWIKTIPGKGWFCYFRLYGPEKDAFNGSWKPGDFEEVFSPTLH